MMGLARDEGSSDAVFPITQVIIKQMKSYMEKEATAENWQFVKILQSIGMVAVQQVSGFKQEHLLFSAETLTEVGKLLTEYQVHPEENSDRNH